MLKTGLLLLLIITYSSAKISYQRTTNAGAADKTDEMTLWSQTESPHTALYGSQTGIVALFNGVPTNYTAYVELYDEIQDPLISVTVQKTEIAYISALGAKGEVEQMDCDDNVTLPSHLLINSTNTTETEMVVEYSESDVVSQISLGSKRCIKVQFQIQGEWLGYSQAEFHMTYTNSTSGKNETIPIGHILITVKRWLRIVDWIFRIAIYFMVCCALLTMGADMDIPKIKEHMKKPKAPLIALFSQFTFMPLLAYGLIHVMKYDGGEALGLFLLGCSPGGGASNMFSKLLNGDMSISVTMTALSTTLSIAMVPFWVYTLGSTLPPTDEVGEIRIPFLAMLRSIAIIIGPLIIGLLIQYKLPRFAKVLKKAMKIMFAFVLITIFSVGVYSNLYIYQSFDWQTILSVTMLPYGGYICGGLLAWIFRLEWKLIKTVSIETGMQNIGLPILIMQAAAASPVFDLAIIPVIAVALMTSLPLYFITIGYIIYQRCYLKKKEKNEEKEGSDESTSAEDDEDKHLANDSNEEKLSHNPSNDSPPPDYELQSMARERTKFIP